MTDFTAYLLAPVPWRLTGVEIISDPQYIFTTYFMLLSNKNRKVSASKNVSGLIFMPQLYRIFTPPCLSPPTG
ncbi:uncharacterized protein METZ01_LOCUS272082, partial [marine metagenome]